MKHSTTLLRAAAALFIVLLAAEPAGAQLRHLWTGLKQPQPAEELPVGKTPAQTPVRVAKRDIASLLTPSGRSEWTISAGWEMAAGQDVVLSGGAVLTEGFDTRDWYNATVPGTVLTTLVDQGVYPDPYFGLNNMAIPDTLARMDWWYRNVFELPANDGGDRVSLLFNGINYIAEVFLNGRKLGNIEGAFIRGEFDITDIVNRSGRNVLAVHILPPKNPGISHEQSIKAGQGLNGGALSMDGPTFISSMGWDWIPGIRDRNIGIWQDVRLRIGGNVRIGDPLVTTRLPNLPDTTRATVTIAVPLRNESQRQAYGTLTARFRNVEVKQDYALAPGETREIVLDPAKYPALNLKNPRLWWPNGYGAQNLYDLTLEATESRGTREATSDSRELRFGIREMSYELMVAGIDNSDPRNVQTTSTQRVLYTPVEAKEPGRPVFDYVNRGRFDRSNQLPTFAQRADMSTIERIPDDDPVGPYIVIRVNGVRIFCRGGNWGMDDGMKRVSRERIEPYLKLHKEAGFNMIRNWTGESTEEVFYALCDEYGMLVWNDFWITTDDTVEPMDVPMFLRNARDVVRRYRNHPSIAVWGPRNEGFAPREMQHSLPEMMAAEDPTRHYHGQSRYLNMDTSGPWGYFRDPSKYYTENAKGFITEIGTFAVPTAATIRKFIGQEDLWPINDVWAYHDLHHTSQNFGDFMAAIDRYGVPQGMEDFVRKAQLVCYDAWRDIMEAWNSRMWNNTTGQVLWMSHPAWPSMIWQTYTYDYETPGSFFGAKKACEPLHVQMNLDDGSVAIVNTTRKAYKGLTASVEFIDPFTGRVAANRSSRHNAAANSMTRCFTPDTPVDLPSLYLVRVRLLSGRDVISVNEYWKTTDENAYARMNELGAAMLKITVRKAKGGHTVEVVNTSGATAVSVKLNAMDGNTGEYILPAYFSDGYFNLLPGEKRVLRLELPESYKGDFSIVAEGYNLLQL